MKLLSELITLSEAAAPTAADIFAVLDKIAESDEESQDDVIRIKGAGAKNAKTYELHVETHNDEVELNFEISIMGNVAKMVETWTNMVKPVNVPLTGSAEDVAYAILQLASSIAEGALNDLDAEDD